MSYNSVPQNYALYTDDDHETWGILFQRHILLHKAISKEYLKGFRNLGVRPNKVVNIEVINEHLKEQSEWTLVPVNGLIPTKDFFQMISGKKYPVTTAIRKRSELDFSEQPDIFHDICGHLPLIINEKFTSFLISFSAIALKYVDNKNAVDSLGRLFWFTYEMGLILEDRKLKAYGGALITSAKEIANSQNKAIPKHKFILKAILNQEYSPFELQKQYFVIDSFDDLFNCLYTLEDALIDKLAHRNN